MDNEPSPTFLETVAVAAPGPDIAQLTSSSSSAGEEGRFLPGALLGGRYRIIGLLGRGGMGEVYRATDLALGQTVALKFLPEEAARNPRLLERFHGEVRVARLVSHPNVCRVFDIGAADGMPFISMEYVDGEDLACLLTRIGRLPSDKALEIARKLCAGLAAAHDRGVIHRDFKPQNIMINKRGDVVIMDFGLAAIADQLSGAEARNGTPAYMAPEQLKGAAVTQASDVYALGLVLYELFTGKQPYEAKTLQRLIDLQESAQLTSMSSIASDVDPAVEKVIRRCLEPDPLKRPASALAVSAALPGGDPLAAALAAGETPTPELVASSGKQEGLARKYSIPCLLLVAASLFGAPWFYARQRAVMRSPLESAPDVLAHRAREISAAFGYPARPADSAVWLEQRPKLLDYLHQLPGTKQWDAWLASEAPIQAVYRESPRPMIARPSGSIQRENPPMSVPGMTSVVVDGFGRLLRFSAIPVEAPAVAAVTPEEVFHAARLDMAPFHEVPPTLVPEHASDTMRAWRGPHPVLPGTELTVQMASWRGQVSAVEVGNPWDAAAAPSAGSSPLRSAREFLVLLLPLVGLFLTALIARRNWKLGRTDRKGAIRVAGARFLLGLLVWAGSMHPVPTQDLLGLFQGAAAQYLIAAAILWLVYLAIEPAVRARYPHAMITWNRVLAGRLLDPQVAGDILIGAAVGCGIWAAAEFIEAAVFGPVQVGGNLVPLLGPRHWIARYLSNAATALTFGLVVFAVICFLRRLVRNDILAALATAVVFTIAEGEVVHAANWAVVDAMYVGVYAILAFVLLRVGIVATISAIFFTNGFSGVWLGADWKAWYAPTGIATIMLMLSVALFAFWKSLGTRDLLGGEKVEAGQTTWPSAPRT